MTRIYRYRLSRVWDHARPTLTWVMLNPSTATPSTDDNTIRRVVGFSKRWGYGSAEVVNLFALRATRPTDLRVANDPVGPDNDTAITSALDAGDVIVAWGNYGTMANPMSGVPRSDEVWDLLGGVEVHCLGITKEGQPRHPLYAPYSHPSVWRNSRHSSSVKERVTDDLARSII